MITNRYKLGLELQRVGGRTSGCTEIDKDEVLGKPCKVSRGKGVLSSGEISKEDG
jgi:hypothetical protein